MSILSNQGIFEVDLVFPRNATYTPQALLPLIWAMQNPDLGSQLTTITWDLWEGNNRSSPGSVAGGLIEEIGSSNEPILVPRYLNTIAYPDGHWTLEWALQFSNCSQDGSDGNVVTQGGSTVFTISSSGQEPDLVAATSAGECDKTDAYAFNVTSSGDCYDLGVTPTANPCAVTINSTESSSIYAAATAYACSPMTPQFVNVTCPTIGSSASNPVGGSRLATAPVLLMLLTAVTNLIYFG